MTNQTEVTRVIFRKWPDGDIIALFPDMDEGRDNIMSYEHAGQHGAASRKLIGALTGCTEAEYAGLKKELESLGYVLSVWHSEEHQARERARDEEQYASLMNTGKCAYASIAEMVAALECDYDRLEELRDERETLLDAIASAETNYNEAEAGSDEAEAGSDEAEAKALDDARSMLEQWDEENGEELKELEEAAGECKDRDEAEQRIQEDPLSIEVRSGWHTPGDSDNEPAEFRILLATGGPAVRIIGELNEYKEPTRARLQVQDWFTPWIDYLEADGEVLLTYCRCFYFGE